MPGYCPAFEQFTTHFLEELAHEPAILANLALRGPFALWMEGFPLSLSGQPQGNSPSCRAIEPERDWGRRVAHGDESQGTGLFESTTQA